MNYINRIIFISLVVSLSPCITAQTIGRMEFRNQGISDILMVLADIGGKSIIIDETITGNATFYFSESEFEDALNQFAEACNFFVEKRNDAYYVSRIKISRINELISIDAEDINIETLIRVLSRFIGRTIVYDTLPRAAINLHSVNIGIRDLLEIIIKRYPDFTILEENNAFYLRQTGQQSQNASSRLGSSSITVKDDLFTMDIQRGSFSAILLLLFRTAGKEYSLLQRVDTTLENLYYSDKTFDDLLRLVLEQSNCDFSVINEIYYIFEIQRRDILKNLKDIHVIQLLHIPVEDAVSLLPSDYNAASFIKINKNTNSVYLTGSVEEIQTIVNFLSILDVPGENKKFHRFEINYLRVSDFMALLPKELSVYSPMVIPGSNSFVVQVNDEIQEQFNEYIALIDIKSSGFPVKLRYIKSEELVQNLPPAIGREEIVLSVDPTLVFYTGTSEKQKQFLEQLLLIDQPKPQIRYQLLVMQYQRSENLNWNKSFSMTNDSEASGTTAVERAADQIITGTFSNLLNIKFDIISAFGYQLAGQINLQIGEDKARVLADTTLNGITGQDIKFENTSTFRYRDATIDPETGKPFYTGVTREITSGLTLSINGWVSGDGMITMQVNATVSKQDEAGANVSTTTNPPPTSTRVVNTQVRTKSGTPIIIGGLLQIEKVSTIKKTPLLGSIPLLGKLFQDIDQSEVTTEMVIYIVPFVHHGDNAFLNYANQNEHYLNKFILHE